MASVCRFSLPKLLFHISRNFDLHRSRPWRILHYSGVSLFSCSAMSVDKKSVHNASEQHPRVDLSEFLLKRLSWSAAPECPDYVGPVDVRITEDGRGRGVFASRRVRAGTLLLISNPMAICYNDTCGILLFQKLVQIARENPAARRRMYALGSTATQTHLSVPSMELLASEDMPSESIVDPVDEQRIMDIMLLNYFSGEVQDTQFSGLWLIPSLINHSCVRNVSRLMVGKAMFLYAARDIESGEEITISYVNLMTPLQNREETYLSRKFSFSCVCKRCAVERSLRHLLKEASERFYALHSKANEEVYSTLSTSQKLPSLDSFPACIELADVYDRVKNALSSIRELSKLDQQLVLCGYSSAYMGKWLASGFSTKFADKAAFVNASALEVIDAKRAAVPGLLSTLSFISTLALLAQSMPGGQAMVSTLTNLAKDECVRVYGNQRQDVLLELSNRSWEIISFA